MKEQSSPAGMEAVVSLNDRSWSAYLDFLAGDASQLDEAALLNREARSLAERWDHPVAIAWCRLQHALILQSQGRMDEAKQEAGHAAAKFDRLTFLEGQAASQIVLGRIAVAHGEKSSARRYFQVADRMLWNVMPVAPSAQLLSAPERSQWEASEKSLGKKWSMQRIDLDRQLSAAADAELRGDWSNAESHLRKAQTLAETIYGPAHPAIIDSLNQQTEIAWITGNFAAACSLQKEAMNIAEKIYDGDSSQLYAAQTLRGLADALRDRSQNEQTLFGQGRQAQREARELMQRKKMPETLARQDEAISLITKVLGDRHPDMADSWNLRADIARLADQPADALRCYRHSIDILEDAGRLNHPDYVTACRQIARIQTELAMIQMTEEALASAVDAHERVLRSETVSDADAPPLLISSKDWGVALKRMQAASAEERRRIQKAWLATESLRSSPEMAASLELTSLQGALDVLPPLFGLDSELAIAIRAALATQYRHAGDSEAAAAELTKARASLQESQIPQNRPVMGQVYLEQVIQSVEQGQLAEALRALDKAKEAWFYADRGQSSAYWNLLRRSVRLHSELGEYARAESDALLAQWIARRLLAPHEPVDVSTLTANETIDQLLHQGDPKAIAYLRATQDLGEVRFAAGLPALAQADYELVAAWSAKLDPRTGDYLSLNALRKLGRICSELHQTERAETLLRSAVDWESRYGTHTFYYADTAHSLAEMLHTQQRWAEALPWYDAAVTAHRATNRDGRWAAIWTNRAACLAALGRRDDALASLATGIALQHRQVTEVVSFRAGRNTWRAKEELLKPWQMLVTMAAESSNSSDVVRQAWNWSLKIKGSALETLMNSRAAQRQFQSKPEITALARQGMDLAHRIAELALNPPPDASVALMESRMERLQAELDEVLGELNRVAAAAGIPREESSLAELQAQLPPRTALIELIRVRLCDWSQFGEPAFHKKDHYLAFVLPPGENSSPLLKDLGEADEIDRTVQELRALIRTAREELKIQSEPYVESIFRKQSFELHRKVFEPLRQELGHADTVYVIPDGELQRVAFETLVDRDDKYLIERFQFAYLSGAGDLLRPVAPPGTGTWIFADPNFDEMPSEEPLSPPSPSKTAPTESDAPSTPADSLEEGDEQRGGKWKKLSYTKLEVDALREALSGTRYEPLHIFENQQASEKALKAVHSPRVLHLATHGFFVADGPPVNAADSRGSTGAGVGLSRLLRQKNPFLRNGLVLCGANRLGNRSLAANGTASEDGWVTAEEIAALELAGTELVVLSACETGLGDVKIGEGVHGLRQAFLYAGAKTIVTSLYQVPDQETQQLMQTFYTGLANNKGTMESLHAAQLSLLRARRLQHRAAHPYFWGSFILVGNPR